MNRKAASCCCLAKNVAFLQNLGQSEETVSLVYGRRHVRFDQDYKARISSVRTKTRN